MTPPVDSMLTGPLRMSLSEAKKLRNFDKRALFAKFRLQVIEDVARRKLSALFNDCCFNCLAQSQLNYDHHIPQLLGGRLVPGNIVLLCPSCNNKKRDKHPADFYTPTQLSVAEKLLEKQYLLFDFKFDWKSWYSNPSDYLLSLGVERIVVDELLAEADRCQALQEQHIAQITTTTPRLDDLG